MRELLERATEMLHMFSVECDSDGLPESAEAAFCTANKLRELAKNAELRDELWAAAKAYGQRFIDVDDDSVDNSRNEWIDAARRDEKTCDAICRRVAESETRRIPCHSK